MFLKSHEKVIPDNKDFKLNTETIALKKTKSFLNKIGDFDLEPSERDKRNYKRSLTRKATFGIELNNLDLNTKSITPNFNDFSTYRSPVFDIHKKISFQRIFWILFANHSFFFHLILALIILIYFEVSEDTHVINMCLFGGCFITYSLCLGIVCGNLLLNVFDLNFRREYILRGFISEEIKKIYIYLGIIHFWIFIILLIFSSFIGIIQKDVISIVLFSITLSLFAMYVIFPLIYKNIKKWIGSDKI